MVSDSSPISRKETIAAVFELEFYKTEDGKEPVEEFLDSLVLLTS